MSSLMLRVRPHPNAMVQDYDALDAFVRRYVGWHHDPSLGANGGFVMDDHVVELPSDGAHAADYLRHLRARDLLPADAATARRAGLPFEEKKP